MLTRKKWKVTLVNLSLVFVFGAAVLVIPPMPVQAATTPVAATASAVPDHLTLTWMQDPKTTQTITWRTAMTVKSGMVQYTRQADQVKFPGNAQSVSETANKLDTNTGSFYIHSATITGLAPGTIYVYRVGDGTNWSNTCTFTTEAANPGFFKFLVFGDSQSGIAADPNYGPWQTCVQNAFAANPDASFITNIGDNVETGQNYNHWENWFAAAKGVIDHIPDMEVQGNHETYLPPDNASSSKPIYWTAQFKLPQNGPGSLPGQTYSYDYGNVHFVVLDSQELEESPISGDILAVQEAWLKQDLANTNKAWKIVMFHKTPYYNKATRSNEDIKAVFDPILDQYHVDVVFNGHDHGYSRTYPINNDQFVSSTNQGTVYIVTGRSGNKVYPDLSQKVWDTFFYDPQDQPMYIAASVKGDTLTLDATKADGTVIDHYVMDKKANTKVATPMFQNTRMVIWGNMCQQPYMETDPAQIGGKWYVPVRSFFQFIGDTVTLSNTSDGTVTIQDGKNTFIVSANNANASVNGKNVALPDKPLLNGGHYLISADDLQTLPGFAWKYDSKANLLYFTK